MANSNKNIVITPNIGSTTADPKIQFSGGNTTVNTDISMFVYPSSNGTLSFEGSAGQLFSITNDLSGSLFSVNDVSGIPSLEVFANGQINLAPYGGNVSFGATSSSLIFNPYFSSNINFTDAGVTRFISTPANNSLSFRFGTVGQGGYGTRDMALSVIGGGYVRVDYSGSGTYHYDTYGSYWHMGYAGIIFNNSGGNGATSPVTFQGVNYVTATTSFRAPIFYDSDNTAYYVDPNTGSNLNGTLINNGGTAMTGGWNRNLLLQSTFPVIVFNSNSTKYSGIGVDYSSAADGFRFYVNGSSTDISATGTVAMQINTGNFVNAAGSFRAPIFYDSADTTYYIDPANSGTSLNLSGSAAIGRSYTATGADIGMAIYHGVDASGYGRIRFYANNANISTIHSFSQNWGSSLAVNSRGAINLTGNFGVTIGQWDTISTAGHWFDNSGNGGSAVSHRSPIYYDFNNTAYYTDPASTSNLNGLTVAGTITGSIQYVTVGMAPNADNYMNFRVMRNNNSTTSNDGMYIGYINTNSGVTRIFGGGASTGEMTKYSDRTEEPGSFRAPVFYDVNNTGFYVDPASLSNINSLAFKGRLAFQTADTSENGLMNLSYLLFKFGNKLYTDEDFNRGTNGISVYNNLGGSALTVARTADATAPNSSRQVLKFTYNGGSNGTSPGLGGFFFGVTCTANRILICTFKAKLPLNYNFEWASNATGTNSNNFWLTSNTGTGKYEEYAYAVMCGNTGSFSTTHYFYVNGTAPANGTVLFDIASATVWDITDNNQTNTESVRAANDMRAPIFYDSDNTAYYLDPANATTSAILNGKVGIGNTTPAHTLRVQGDISLSGGVHANGSLGTSGHILTTNGTGSYWAAANVANVTGVLPINNGGTNSTATPTQYGIAYGTGTAYAFTAQSSIGQFLYGLGSVNPPVWVTLDLDFMPEAWVKKTVRVATTANITLSGTQTVDGVALVSGDRILVKNQTTASQNGIYIVLAGAWSRQDTQTNIPGAIVTVSAGTVNAGRTYRTDFKATDTFNSTAMNWYQVLDEATGATRSRAIAMSMLFG